jgi:hypothetical protein
VLRFDDGSSLTIPRAFSGRITDVVPDGEYARRVIAAAAAWPSHAAPTPHPATNASQCRWLRSVAVNKAFYQTEPDAMRRYTALAWDNIRRDPAAYLASCAYRVWRLFIVSGTDDQWTAQQFHGSRLVYGIASVVSAGYLCLLLAGVVVAVRQRRPLAILLTPIVYVPLTIAWVLTNMRYTVTVQPLVFAFIALAVRATLDRVSRR